MPKEEKYEGPFESQEEEDMAYRRRQRLSEREKAEREAAEKEQREKDEKEGKGKKKSGLLDLVA